MMRCSRSDISNELNIKIWNEEVQNVTEFCCLGSTSQNTEEARRCKKQGYTSKKRFLYENILVLNLDLNGRRIEEVLEGVQTVQSVEVNNVQEDHDRLTLLLMWVVEVFSMLTRRELPGIRTSKGSHQINQKTVD